MVWSLTFLHAFARHKASVLGWAEQCFLIALLGMLAVCANAFSTGDHILRSLTDGNYAVAGMDILMTLSSVVALAVSIKLFKENHKNMAATKNIPVSQS